MRTRLAPLAVFGCVLAGLAWVYWPTRQFPFIDADDPTYVLHPRVVAPPTFENLWWLLTHAIAVNWTPLTWYTHVVDHQLFGPNSGAHHASNVVWHAAVCSAVFAFLREATRNTWRSLAVTLLFAFHPLRVESVAWVVERKDLVSGFFGALSLWAYAHYARAQTGRARWYAAAFAAFVLSLLGKAMLVTMPFLLLLLDYWPLKRTASVRALVLEKLPFLVPALGASYVARYGVVATDVANDPLSLGQRVWNAVFSTAQYLRKSLLPSDLSFWYPHPYLPSTGGRGLDAVTIGECVALLVLIALLCLQSWRRRPYLAVGMAWFVGTLVPVSGVYVQAGRQGMADRYVYFPSIGLGIALVWTIANALSALEPKRARTLAVTLVTACVLVFAWRSRVEAMRWQSTEILYTDVLLKNPNDAHIQYLLGRMQLERGAVDQGLAHLVRAATLMPEWDDLVTGAADALRNAGRADEALHWYRIAYQRAPQYNHTRVNLATALAGAGRYDEALALFAEAAKQKPRSVTTRVNLASTLAMLGRFPEANAELEIALQLEPSSPQALFASARVRAQLGDARGAIERIDQLLRVVPQHPGGLELQRQLQAKAAVVQPASPSP